MLSGTAFVSLIYDCMFPSKKAKIPKRLSKLP